jgi:Raf kinase inhibitor-like YbhB/YbcL family protein
VSQPRARRMRIAAVSVAGAIASILPVSGCGLLNGSNVLASAPAVMTVSSTEITGSVLPHRYTCYTSRVTSPPLSWSGAPPSTKSFALVVDDASAPITPYVYWIVFNIGQNTTSLAQGQLPFGAQQAQGSNGAAAYNAPCPAGQPHNYRFTVYALDKTLKLPPGATLKDAWQAIATATIGRGRMTVKVIP